MKNFTNETNDRIGAYFSSSLTIISFPSIKNHLTDFSAHPLPDTYCLKIFADVIFSYTIFAPLSANY